MIIAKYVIGSTLALMMNGIADIGASRVQKLKIAMTDKSMVISRKAGE